MSRLVDHDAVALLAAQSRIRGVVRRVLWRDFPGVASAELVERVCQAVFKELRLCCGDCACDAPEPGPGVALQLQPIANRRCGCR